MFVFSINQLFESMFFFSLKACSLGFVIIKNEISMLIFLFVHYLIAVYVVVYFLRGMMEEVSESDKLIYSDAYAHLMQAGALHMAEQMVVCSNQTHSRMYHDDTLIFKKLIYNFFSEDNSFFHCNNHTYDFRLL